jgi:hypothetical protein
MLIVLGPRGSLEGQISRVARELTLENQPSSQPSNVQPLARQPMTAATVR